MIYTRFGNPCTITSPIKDGKVRVSIDYKDGGPLADKTFNVSDLRADEGIEEIQRAADNSLIACIARNETR